MNALVGHEANTNCSLFLRLIDASANDGGRNDGGDFRRAGGGAHLGGGW